MNDGAEALVMVEVVGVGVASNKEKERRNSFHEFEAADQTA